MYDEYFMNKLTGELLPSDDAIHEFYKTHGALEPWTDEWEPTGRTTEQSRTEQEAQNA